MVMPVVHDAFCLRGEGDGAPLMPATLIGSVGAGSRREVSLLVRRPCCLRQPPDGESPFSDPPCSELLPSEEAPSSRGTV